MRGVALFGQPGSGKTTIGRLLARQLGAQHLDIDDDWLEPRWGCRVGDKLAEVGDDSFLALERKEMAHLEVSDGTVISLTGSNGLCAETMERIRERCAVVFLDTPVSTIVKRAQHMKVDRIVGQASLGLDQVLHNRQQAYQRHYDLRVYVGEHDSPQQVCTSVQRALQVHSGGYVTTRSAAEDAVAGVDEDNDRRYTFDEVVKRGLGPTGGLFMPAVMPEAMTDLKFFEGLSFPQLVLRVMERFSLGATVRPSELAAEIERAYATFDHDDVLPVSVLHDDVHLVEMFHGPTLSFKDLSLQLLPRILKLCTHSSSPHADERRVSMLVATSGDTGTAALEGFHHNPVAVLYPHGGVSPVQEAQMQTASADSLVIGVSGEDFDSCQTLVKSIVNQGISGHRVSSANSMNWARFLPQIAYALHVYTSTFRDAEKFEMAYPTGNFGNALGAIEAAKLFGLDLRVICCSNDNDVVHEFLQKGVYDIRNRSLQKTLSPAMDILRASNLERFIYLIYREHLALGHREAAARVSSHYAELNADGVFRVPDAVVAAFSAHVDSGRCSDEECLEAIRQLHASTGRLVDPHTAVAYHVGMQKKTDGVPLALCSTAHFAKFPDTVLEALDMSPNHGQRASLAELFDGLKKATRRSPASQHNEIPARVLQLTELPRNHTEVLDLDEASRAVKRYFNSYK